MSLIVPLAFHRPLRQLVGANNAAPRQAALPSATPLDTVKCNGHVLRSGSFVYAMSPRGERRPAQIISLYPLADDDFTATVRWLRCKPTDDGELVRNTETSRVAEGRGCGIDLDWSEENHIENNVQSEGRPRTGGFQAVMQKKKSERRTETMTYFFFPAVKTCLCSRGRALSSRLTYHPCLFHLTDGRSHSRSKCWQISRACSFN